MPTYEYECGKCGRRFEKFQQITAKPVKTCPQCRGRVRRLPGTGGAIMIKGYSRSGGGPLPCGRDAPCHGPDSPCTFGAGDH